MVSMFVFINKEDCMNDILNTKDGPVEKTTGRKIKSPVDTDSIVDKKEFGLIVSRGSGEYLVPTTNVHCLIEIDDFDNNLNKLFVRIRDNGEKIDIVDNLVNNGIVSLLPESLNLLYDRHYEF